MDRSRYKIGDHLISKIDFNMKTGELALIKNKAYIITDFEYDNRVNIHSEYHKFHIFDDSFFYTEKKLRKVKIKKLIK
jgi:hypothetical protein